MCLAPISPAPQTLRRHTPEAQARAVRGVVLPVHIKLDLCTKQNIICEELFDLFSAWTAHYVGEISCDRRHPGLQDSPKTASKTASKKAPKTAFQLHFPGSTLALVYRAAQSVCSPKG